LSSVPGIQPEFQSSRGAFVELDTRKNFGLTVSLEWERETGETQIVVEDALAETHFVVAVPGASAAEAFRHPYRYLS
jgi:hypothetical protein